MYLLEHRDGEWAEWHGSFRGKENIYLQSLMDVWLAMYKIDRRVGDGDDREREVRFTRVHSKHSSRVVYEGKFSAAVEWLLDVETELRLAKKRELERLMQS